MSLIIVEVKDGAIYIDDSSRNDYYVIKISPSPYTHKLALSIDGKVISSDEMVCGGTYFFQLLSIIIIVFLHKINPIT